MDNCSGEGGNSASDGKNTMYSKDSAELVAHFLYFLPWNLMGLLDHQSDHRDCPWIISFYNIKFGQTHLKLKKMLHLDKHEKISAKIWQLLTFLSISFQLFFPPSAYNLGVLKNS